MNWWKNLKGKVKLNEPLCKHTSFRIGSAVRFFIEPADIEELKLIVSYAKKQRLKLLVIGAGSNILAADKASAAVVVRLSSGFFSKISCKSNYIEAGSGVALARLVKVALGKQLSGVEFLAGIPGTVGGALFMNAGGWGQNIGDLVAHVKVMDYNNKTLYLDKKDLRFGYRCADFSRYIILGARLKLKRASRQFIKKRLKEYIDYRRDTQDLHWPSAGCVFKNPKDHSAGRLIDACGLKGKSIGGAQVSERHANFILNRNNAKAGDVVKLMKFVEKKVKSKFNIKLEPEIKLWL